MFSIPYQKPSEPGWPFLKIRNGIKISKPIFCYKTGQENWVNEYKMTCQKVQRSSFGVRDSESPDYENELNNYDIPFPDPSSLKSKPKNEKQTM